MKQIVLSICRFRGFKRKRPNTKLGKCFRWCEHSVGIIGVLYFLLLAYPQPLFAYKFEQNDIQVYSTVPIPEEATALLSQVHSQTLTSKLYRESDTFKIFICNDKKLYSVLAMGYRHSFGASFPVINNIIISQGDFEKNACTAFTSKYNKRSLTSVMVHEMGHVLMCRRFGFWINHQLPTWLKEGYCEVLSGDSSFPETEGRKLMAEGKSDPSGSFKYYTYRSMVDYLMSEKGHTITQLVKDTPDKDHVMIETQEWLRDK